MSSADAEARWAANRPTHVLPFAGLRRSGALSSNTRKELRRCLGRSSRSS